MSIVKNYMRKDISTISTEALATEASKTMLTDKVGYIIVLEKGRPVGIVTERDLVLKVMAEDKNPKETKISECMSSPLVTIDPDKNIEEAVESMKKHGFRRLPVVKNDIIYGIFSARDLVEHFEEFEDKLTRDLVRFMPW
ncbi:MAG: CBS domain-containing protein [Candidatus Bathyarchaeota archaeon]|nr:CBS domain-containing protein [Candidatus Bathyarchaeota archaeon]